VVPFGWLFDWLFDWFDPRRPPGAGAGATHRQAPRTRSAGGAAQVRPESDAGLWCSLILWCPQYL